MSGIIVLCFGMSFGYILRGANNYYQLNKEYRNGQRYGYEIGCRQAEVVGFKVKSLGENIHGQLVVLMDIQDLEKK